MKLKQVTIEETQIAMSVLKESAEWLKEQGSNQWSEVLQGEDKHGLEEAVTKGEVYFFYNSKNQLIGMAAAWKTPTEWDKLLWKDFGFHQSACYIHRVIIRPTYRGKAYGEELLSALKRKFLDEVSELRLDCLGSNQKLIQFYQENGFVNIGSSKDSNENEFELFLYKL
ncbi:GNAT family N-acetyltransferase [Enterococcus plantarum]|nr:GNAT family N-acetyltransferase [Enterococcus plantarum]